MTPTGCAPSTNAIAVYTSLQETPHVSAKYMFPPSPLDNYSKRPLDAPHIGTSTISIMTQDETPVNLRKPLMHWAEKTPRWLLALAATDHGWLPEQQDDAVDELTQEEFEAAIASTKAGYEEACKANKGKRMCKALVHDSLLIACVVRRVSPGEESALIEKIRAAAEDDERKAGDMIRQQFQQVIVYPSVAKVIAVRDLAPRSYVVLATKWQMSLGMEAEQSAKKR